MAKTNSRCDRWYGSPRTVHLFQKQRDKYQQHVLCLDTTAFLRWGALDTTLTHRVPPRSHWVRSPMQALCNNGRPESRYRPFNSAKCVASASYACLRPCCVKSLVCVASIELAVLRYSQIPNANITMTNASMLSVTVSPVRLEGRSDRFPSRFVLGSGPTNAAKSANDH